MRYAAKSHWLGTFHIKEGTASEHDAAIRQHASEIRNAACNYESAEAGKVAKSHFRSGKVGCKHRS